jgi:hypothetical protein
MLPRSRLFARFLRVVVACVVLGVVGAGSAPALASVDVAGWVAGASNGRAAEPGKGEEAPAPELAQSPLSAPAPGERREASTFPAGARAVVVSARLYLRHAALLC